jgi:4-hydroxy-L-threonine phosphate dehydrogenase PdxA
MELILTGENQCFKCLERGFKWCGDPNGEYAIKSFVAATKALKDDLIDVLVTAPINKYNIQSEDFKFPGHTDYLDQELEGVLCLWFRII